ncbi:MAG: AI-2E family transporter [Lachnospiraceae bacterium]|nr:AI-2E family transporter [Lachnospiraceae bacterium]MBP5184091.1 AI-2E family transporter [Lachnospiraceae bacterium]
MKKFKLFGRFKNNLHGLKEKKKTPYDNSPVKIGFSVASDDMNNDNASDLKDDLPEGIELEQKDHIRSAEDDVFESLNGSAHREAFKFTPNSKYTTILLYAIFFVLIASFIVIGINKGTILGSIVFFFKTASPFLVALFVALVLERPVSFIEEKLWGRVFRKKPRKGLRRALAILLTYLIFFGLVFILFRFVIPQLAQSFMDLSNRSEEYVRQLLDFVSEVERRVPGLELGDIEKTIIDQSHNIMAFVGTQIAPRLLRIATQTAKTVFSVIISVIVSVYILYDKRNLKVSALRAVYTILPISKATSLSKTVTECVSIFTNFVFGKTLDSLIIGMISFIVLSIGRFPYAVLVSVIIGVTNMIPYFGPFIGAVPGGIIYLCINPKLCLAFLIIVLIIQQCDGLVIGPKILGDSTGLSPLWVIIGTTVGGAYGSVLGMFLGVPTTAVISFLLGRLINNILEKKKIDIS